MEIYVLIDKEDDDDGSYCNVEVFKTLKGVKARFYELVNESKQYVTEIYYKDSTTYECLEGDNYRLITFEKQEMKK